MMSQSFPSDVALACGEVLHLSVDAGAVLLAADGAVRVEEAPRWLAERMVPVRGVLAQGQAHVVERAGWVRVQAAGSGAARVRCLPGAEPWYRALRLRLGRWRWRGPRAIG
ncbi:hypothetical protein [Pseudorhodoferax sp.]|uniref:hypothetical protein n=1 Tax=Pseudorhodoferax sp. TaxID=1993553 RepID=UPI0039E3E86B